MNYTKSNSLWEVTTGSDCEGKSIKNLGIYQGDLSDIAFYLADKCCYRLCFKQIEFKKAGKATGKKVNISLNIDSNTWSMNPKDRVKAVKNMLNNDNVIVKESNYYACVTLCKDTTKEDALKSNALAKLTEEEIKALGL